MIHMIWCAIFLGICAITDLKERQVYLGFCLANMGIALLANLIFQNVEWTSIVAGLGLGVVFFAVCIITKEAMGKGDAVIILVLGSICGIKISFEIVTWAFVICSMVSIFEILIKRKSIKSEIPFAPFLFCGCILTMFIREAG